MAVAVVVGVATAVAAVAVAVARKSASGSSKMGHPLLGSKIVQHRFDFRAKFEHRCETACVPPILDLEIDPRSASEWPSISGPILTPALAKIPNDPTPTAARRYVDIKHYILKIPVGAGA